MTGVMVTSDSCFFEYPVHPLHLTMGSRVVRLAQTRVDTVGVADLVEEVGSPPNGWARAVLGRIAELHTVIDQHRIRGLPSSVRTSAISR